MGMPVDDVLLDCRYATSEDVFTVFLSQLTVALVDADGS